MASNKVMEDYRGNSSFTRWFVLGCVIVAILLVVATIRWSTAQVAFLHAFDKLLETATWVFLGGKSPEIVNAFRAKIQAVIAGKSSSDPAPAPDPPAPPAEG